MSNSIILNEPQINQKINRMSFQILEEAYAFDKVFLVGIQGVGFTLAEELLATLSKSSDQEFCLVKISLDKKNPSDNSIDISCEISEFKDQCVILIDDVVNSGSTLIHSASELLKGEVKVLKTAVLVNRSHRKFPIMADIVGLSLSTTIQDNIVVELEPKKVAFLE